MKNTYDVIIVGAGPNGLAAGIFLAQKGKKVLLLEEQSQIGGACRTEELTLPGFHHDVGSAIYPLGIASPFLKTLPLEKFGLKWIHPPICLAHPLEDGSARSIFRSLDETVMHLGRDAQSYRRLVSPFLKNYDSLIQNLLGPLRFPRHPFRLMYFGIHALLSSHLLNHLYFKDPGTRALMAGIGAHSFLKLTTPTSAAIGLVLLLTAHAYGWPLPEGGSGALTRAMADYFRSLGGEIQTGIYIKDKRELPSSRAVLWNLNTAQILKLGENTLPESYEASLRRFVPGPGAFKIDYALSAPIPWLSKECHIAGTVHLGGSQAEIESSERAHWEGNHFNKPFVLVSQPTLFDPTRAPPGKHIAWVYCHTPFDSTIDCTDAIENQIERFAPGFRKLILKRAKSFCQDLKSQNRNLEGGDISGGAPIPSQMLFRPAFKFNPYRIPTRSSDDSWWLCSASTPPGAGVHGLCGLRAAKALLKTL